jgi:hypothetical protein
MAKFAQYFRINLKASCGGKSQMIQGSVLEKKEEIIKVLEQYQP